jgi:hypothetical protein
LAIRLLHAENIWNHRAFFDYVDRWMTEDNSKAIARIKRETGFDYDQNWQRQRETRYWLQGQFPEPAFVDDMCKKYRSAPTD